MNEEDDGTSRYVEGGGEIEDGSVGVESRED